MTTPAFVPQSTANIPAVRFYTQFDPYYYSVDNRPLTDLDTNIRSVATSGGDSSRRAVLLTQLGLSEVFRQLFTSASGSPTAVGLGMTNPTGTTIQILPGAIYSLDFVNTSVSTQVLKQFLLLSSVQLSIPAPATTGQSINYLVQAALTTEDNTTMLTSALPFVDATNTLLPGCLLNGELKISIKAGTAATTGTQATPTADSGNIPLYIVTSTYGVATPTVVLSTAASAPVIQGYNATHNIIYPTTGAATTTSVGGLPIATMPSGSTTSVVATIATANKPINPFAPLKVSLLVSSPATSGNAQVQLQYLSMAEGGSTTASAVSLTAETISVPGTANTLLTKALTGSIPPSAFASFVSNTWKVSADKINLTISRNGGSDTLSNVLYVHDIIISQ
jgi:hypothetical protein